jgi:hypothetical protein
MRRAWITLISVVGTLAACSVAGCDGTSSGGINNPVPTHASATGVWGGTDSVTGLSVVGVYRFRR